MLWNMYPYLISTNKTDCLRLISDIELNRQSITATAVILGSVPLHIKSSKMTVDNNNKLHGYCVLSILKDDENLVPRDKTLGWVPHKIAGYFIHGKLNGIAIIVTNHNSYGWVTATNGILHGPIVVYGLHAILPVSSEYNF